MAGLKLKNILVTGGAGYIGSHACKALKRRGFTPVTFDNLSTGWLEAVKFGPFFQGDLLDQAALDAVFTHYKPKAVMHFAALSQVGQSMREPGNYWRNNVQGSLNLIEAAVHHKCEKFVFSSTCATYGDQDNVVLDENCSQNPINAYGSSKRAIEEILSNFSASDGLNYIIFRYFNVTGADSDAEIGECHQPETHLIPLILETISGRRSSLTIHGTDYDTEDGTCIRDYVHVSDLVDAHILGLEWLIEDKGNRIFNLGTGRGYSVREVIDQASRITNHLIPVQNGNRRSGDCQKLVSGSKRASEELGWKPDRSNLQQMVSDAWRWEQKARYVK